MDKTRKKIIVTIDVESLFHANPMYEHLSSPRKFEADAGFTQRATEKILDLLSIHQGKATFFIVAEINRWYPDLCRKIAEKGHEIAYHTNSHKIINAPDDIESDLKSSYDFLDQWQPRGFRSPYYHLPELQVCSTVLRNKGFRYDSSCYGNRSHVEIIKDFHEIFIPFLPYSKGRTKEAIKNSGLKITDIFTGFPIGSGLSWSFPSGVINFFLERAIETSAVPLVTLHPWQLVRPQYVHFLKPSFIIRHPWWLPYAASAQTHFHRFLDHYDTISIQDYLEQDCHDRPRL